jgi:hypothetical protein
VQSASISIAAACGDKLTARSRDHVIVAGVQEAMKKRVGGRQGWGYSVHMIDREQFKRLAPYATPGESGCCNFAGQEVEFMTLGYRVMPKENYPMAGGFETYGKLYVAALHSGMTMAPISGQFASLEILDGARVDMLAPYRPERFS